MINPSTWDVYLVTDRGLAKGRTTLEIVQAAVKGGVSAVQLREKNVQTRLFYEEGLKIRDFLRGKGIPLIINDRLDIALALDADGVHVGADDMPVQIAREILGAHKIIGLSVNQPSEMNEDAAKFADYLGISPVFSTTTKLDLLAPWGLEGVNKACGITDLPLVGIGGIDATNAADVIKAGADCVAVVSGIVSAEDPTLATRRLVAQVRAGKASRCN